MERSTEPIALPVSWNGHEIVQLAPLNIVLDLIDDRITGDKVSFQRCFTVYNETFHIIKAHRIGYIDHRHITESMVSKTRRGKVAIRYKFNDSVISVSYLGSYNSPLGSPRRT